MYLIHWAIPFYICTPYYTEGLGNPGGRGFYFNAFPEGLFSKS